MKLHKIIERIAAWRYRNYAPLTVSATARHTRFSEHLINESKITFQIVELEGKVKFVNRGTIKGIILARDADIYNYGLIEGIVYSKKGTLHLFDKSDFTGVAYSYMIGLQPGCSIDSWIGQDLSKFIELTQERVSSSDLADIKRIISAWQD
ncbi:MAG: hypothetical protein AAFO03_01645 [Bacteroidota bacterium]